MSAIIWESVNAALRAGHEKAPHRLSDLSEADQRLAYAQMQAAITTLTETVTNVMAQRGAAALAHCKAAKLNARDTAVFVYVAMLTEAARE